MAIFLECYFDYLPALAGLGTPIGRACQKTAGYSQAELWDEG
ncbi:MAG: hypothetical protein VX876_00400 [Planctomycetota bacterium]|nr:hypothetical protein [Planctomycetota bacterium]